MKRKRETWKIEVKFGQKFVVIFVQTILKTGGHENLKGVGVYYFLEESLLRQEMFVFVLLKCFSAQDPVIMGVQLKPKHTPLLCFQSFSPYFNKSVMVILTGKWLFLWEQNLSWIQVQDKQLWKKAAIEIFLPVTRQPESMALGVFPSNPQVAFLFSSLAKTGVEPFINDNAVNTRKQMCKRTLIKTLLQTSQCTSSTKEYRILPKDNYNNRVSYSCQTRQHEVLWQSKCKQCDGKSNDNKT